MRKRKIFHFLYLLLKQNRTQQVIIYIFNKFNLKLIESLINNVRRRSKLSIQIESLKEALFEYEGYSNGNSFEDESFDIKNSLNSSDCESNQIEEQEQEQEQESPCKEIKEIKPKEEKKIIEMKKFEVCFYLNLNKTENIYFIETDPFDVDKHQTHELIENIVKKINNRNLSFIYKDKEYDLSLQESTEKDFYVENYELRPCKKNSTPKYDMPAYSTDIPLRNIINERICFGSKKHMNILLREKIIEEEEDMDQEQGRCNSFKNKCVIM